MVFINYFGTKREQGFNVSAVIYDIALEKGSLFSIACTYKDEIGTAIDITDLELRGSVKSKSTETLKLCSITCTITDATNGEFTVSIVPTESIKLETKGKSYLDTTTFYYDVELFDPLNVENVTRMMNGSVIVSPEQTTKED